MSNHDKKRPWLKFYPSDWRGDPKLRMCSIGARGLWAEMICLMHEADPYGHLLVNNVPVTNRQLASLAGIPQSDCMKFMAELESSGVYSRAEDKTIFSRRMVRDANKSLQGKRDADRRWGNGGEYGEPTRRPNGSPIGKPITLDAKCQIDDAETRAGASLITPEAFEITTALEQACGFALPEEIPPGWYGCAMWVQKCLNEGWIGEVMVEGARGAARRVKGGFVQSFHYLEKPLAQAMAEYKAPLPKIEIREQETVHVTANRPSGGSSAHDAIARLRARVEGERGDDHATNPDAIRLISSG